MTTISLPNHVAFTNGASFKNCYVLFKPSAQDKKFTTILAILFTLYFIIAVIVPFLEQVEIPREIKEQIPVQLAKVVLKEKQLRLPQKPKEKIIVEKKIKDKPEEIKKENSKKEPVKQSILSIDKKRALAKKTANKSGLAAMKDELFAMREAFDSKPSTSTNLRKDSKSSEVKIKRKLLVSEVNKKSNVLSAVKTSSVVSHDVLSTRDTQKIHLSNEEVLANTDVIVEEKLTKVNSKQRSEMSLRRSLEKNKARLYTRYNKALRKDPFLQGKVLFEIEIQPSGKISKVIIKSSELNNPILERQLLVILRSITFPTAGVAVTKTIWAIDFLPN